jgi:hypothetical protein
MLIVLGGLAEFERELIPRPHRRSAGTRKGAWRVKLGQAKAHPAPEARGSGAPRDRRRDTCRDRPQLQREPQHDFAADSMTKAAARHPLTGAG